MQSIAFLGPNGTYSHEAAMQYSKNRDASLIPQVTIKDVFDAVLSGSVTHGLVPIENSTNGSVTMTFDLFRDLKHGNLKVCGQEFVRVRHSLLGQCPLNQIERIYSHPQVSRPGFDILTFKAFGQCEIWLDKHLKGVERVNVTSTSRAARMLKDDPKGAAIANRICKDIYGTGMIAEDIHDNARMILGDV
jgi:prephenate dehydratase